ncbi:hypothetical protein F5X96DRAFT_692947 [Biscogniauxia mediterranea]|nr:hypothetical protein F5X96DRAFT_692947 [Biscogniauxia mediterranea]
MATKTKVTNPLNGLHTAGIFSDMSVDGPEIGTLVLIVDRAKNLPNRKTIGKQDPYAAARLGKEAKKTTTDIRGGQTPKWDQELRFTVHDSPDYYQLKLSVFNDDKKTDLIGETWIDLRDIVVQGGGQSDQWHSLNCKGKYAGEIRIEITYYDSRPKPEKQVARLRPVASNLELSTPSAPSRQPVKRRPLPSDPVTGQAPAPVVTEHAHAARPQPIPPSQSSPAAIEYGTSPSGRHSHHPDHYSPVASSGSQYATPPHRGDLQLQRTPDRADIFPSYEASPHHQELALSSSYEPDPWASYNHAQPSYDTPSPPVHHQHHHVDDDEERPPPPPAHRVRNSTGNFHDLTHQRSFEVPQHKSTALMRHDVLRSEAHRQSISSSSSPYPGRPTYRPYDSVPDMQKAIQYHDSSPDYHSHPRHQSYDSAYDAHHRSMQPTVEDVPESWTPPNARSRGNSARALQYDDLEFDQMAHSSPTGFNGRGSAAPDHYSPSPPQPQPRYDTNGYTSSPSPIPVEYSQALTLTRASRSYTSPVDQFPSNPETSLVHIPSTYDMPPVPPTLVPGVDPALAREISERLHEEREREKKRERRYTQPAPINPETRGRQHSEPPSNYAPNYPPQGHHLSNSRSYDRAIAYQSGPTTPSGPPQNSRPRGLSPSPGAPTHTIKRKSVSPAPPPSDTRRLSGVPFGPDSYDALNPSVSTKDVSKSAEYTNADGKIVTSDGREVDPSDHLPMDTWAPEPEPKKGTQPETTRSRPVPVGAQPMPPSGRRQLRIAARPQSMISSSPHTMPEATPSPPVSTGRNRLQKKAHRASALPAPVSSGSGPLGPATSHQRNSTPPRALVRASTFDYENYGPPYGSGSGAARAGYGSGPPIPAKVPMMSGGLGPSHGEPRDSEQWALMQEMSRIDIGSGRARRRHGGY